MNHPRMEKLQEIGEHETIRRLTALLGGHPQLRTGAGDDCAVTELPGTGNDQIFTTDPIIENVHFKSGEKPERIGHKAVGRVLSDIAAMGARPQWLLVNVVAPLEQDVYALERIYVGMNALCHRFGATIIGGDLAQGSCLELHVFGTGTVPSGTALLRSGARPGDCIFTTGSLGCSIAGKHLDFVPRIEEGIFLRQTEWVTAMLDISDGLATDLRHILKQSRVGAVLDADKIPRNGSLEQALHDGEDFELLFTVPPENAGDLCGRWQERFGNKLVAIGEITEEVEILKLKRDKEVQILERKAFEHFSTTV